MTRQKILVETPDLDIRLTWYRPGEAMAAHVHAEHQVSWLLAGDVRETSAGRERDLLRASRGVKPAGCDHANLYGPSGALILALNIQPGSPFCDGLAGLDEWTWSPVSDGLSGDVMRIALALSRGAVAPDLALSDLAACIAEPDPARPRAVSRATEPWLSRVREQLRDGSGDPDMTQLAEAAGVHRVHLSRSFARQFGLPPSLYRLRCKLGRAFCGLMHGDNPVEAAQAGGFADQSHFTRAARRQTGLTPHHLRALLAA